MSAQEVQVLQPSGVPLSEKDIPTSQVIEVDSGSSTPRRRLIVQSPYEELDHQLDLNTLDYENAILAQALSALRNTRDDYATAPYAESFNWEEVIAEVRRLTTEHGRSFKEASFYVVAFRSQIKPSTDYSHLGELDKAAHAEAVASGGFLKYWFGSPDSELRNLATCLWRSREDALLGGRGPAHRKAAGSTRSLYAYWKIDQHRLTIRDDVNSWEITTW